MKIKNITLHSILLAIGIVLQLFENYLPTIVGIPGGKLGIANIVTILCINLLSVKSTLIICTFRPVISSLLYGGITQLPFSLAGSLLSSIIMIIIIKKSDKFSYIGAAIIGAATHNFAQVTVAALMYSNLLIYSYLPLLLIISIISGYFTGFCSTLIIRKYKKRKNV